MIMEIGNMPLKLTFEAEDAGSLHDSISKYLAHNGDTTIVKTDAAAKVAKDAASAAGSTATTVRPDGRSKEAKAAKAAAEAKPEVKSEPEPEVEVAGEIETGKTRDEVREALIEFRKKSPDPNNALGPFMAKWGVKKVGELDPKHFDEVYAAAKSAIEALEGDDV